jgi:hypothetical protein
MIYSTSSKEQWYYPQQSRRKTHDITFGNYRKSGTKDPKIQGKHKE